MSVQCWSSGKLRSLPVFWYAPAMQTRGKLQAGPLCNHGLVFGRSGDGHTALQLRSSRSLHSPHRERKRLESPLRAQRCQVAHLAKMVANPSQASPQRIDVSCGLHVRYTREDLLPPGWSRRHLIPYCGKSMLGKSWRNAWSAWYRGFIPS